MCPPGTSPDQISFRPGTRRRCGKRDRDSESRRLFRFEWRSLAARNSGWFGPASPLCSGRMERPSVPRARSRHTRPACRKPAHFRVDPHPGPTRPEGTRGQRCIRDAWIVYRLKRTVVVDFRLSIQKVPEEAAMRKAIVGLALFVVVAALPSAEAPYYPPAGQWAHKNPAELGMDAAKLNDAVEFMKT